MYGTHIVPAEYKSSYRIINTDWAYEDDKYDACADLSWVTLTVPATASSARQIMLFHKGEYIGTPAKVAFGFHPDVVRLANDKIQVSYRWNEGSEAVAEATVRAVSTFTYNPSSGGVNHEGDFPDYGLTDSKGNLPADKAVPFGAPVSSGGDITGHTIEMKTFATPSRNILCDLADGNCFIMDPGRTITLGGYDESPEIREQIATSAQEAVTDAPLGDYGTTLYSGSNACAVEESGVTC